MRPLHWAAPRDVLSSFPVQYVRQTYIIHWRFLSDRRNVKHRIHGHLRKELIVMWRIVKYVRSEID